jgi:hypothetical protein
MIRGAAVAWVALAIGCGGQIDHAPPSNPGSPEVLFLVRNEVFSIRLDGRGRRSLGSVGDDRHRTGYPRFLPDGRVAVLGDDTGGIFPYFGGGEGSAFQRIGLTNVSINDALCGATAGGSPLLVLTASPYSDALPIATRLYRFDVDHPQLEAVGFQGPAEYGDGEPGSISEPAQYDDGQVLTVRSRRPDADAAGTASIEILRIDRPGDHDVARTTTTLVTLEPGYLARSPARLPDGRVLFIRTDPSDISDTGIGELFVLGLDGQVRSTGITGVLALETIGDQVIYEIADAYGVSDLVRTDLVHPPVNLTQTQFVSEHLAWSD